ncbi:hypothetical protein M2263_001725 [Providencia alcalifaciens]|nr:hypothetical protein [Providencia alcalifaciens]
MKDLILGGTVFIPGITLVLFLGFFLWLSIRFIYVNLVMKNEYAGSIFDISMLFFCILITHVITNL